MFDHHRPVPRRRVRRSAPRAVAAHAGRGRRVGRGASDADLPRFARRPATPAAARGPRATLGEGPEPLRARLFGPRAPLLKIEV